MVEKSEVYTTTDLKNVYTTFGRERLMERLWKRIDGFPNYSVSNYGDVLNEHTGRLVRQSFTMQGAVKVNLMVDHTRCTKSVKVLVAEAFVDGRDELFDTPIHLDGYQEHNFAWNIVWRPRWFAWQYSRQFTVVSDYYSVGPLIELESNTEYVDVYEAATTNGLLFKGVWRSIHFKDPVFPTRQRFSLLI